MGTRVEEGSQEERHFVFNAKQDGWDQLGTKHDRTLFYHPRSAALPPAIRPIPEPINKLDLIAKPLAKSQTDSHCFGRGMKKLVTA